MKTFRRDKLRRLVEARRVEVVGSYHYDEMQGEHRSGAEGRLALLAPADWKDRTEAGACYIPAWDFKSLCGKAWEESGLVTLYVHSNHNWTFRILDRPRPEPRPCMVCKAPTSHRFFCPCDLEHPICPGEHQADPEGAPRLDCAFIRIREQKVVGTNTMTTEAPAPTGRPNLILIKGGK